MLVVGGGNSGFQIAQELAASRQVDLSIGTRNPKLPQRLAGEDLFWWLTGSGSCGSRPAPGSAGASRRVAIQEGRRPMRGHTGRPPLALSRESTMWED